VVGFVFNKKKQQKITTFWLRQGGLPASGACPPALFNLFAFFT
jgi:hypothetical protein